MTDSKPAREITINPLAKKQKTKRKIALLERVTLEQVAPDVQELLSKTEQLKRMLLKEVPKEEREFRKKAMELCSDSSNEAWRSPVEHVANQNSLTSNREAFMSYISTALKKKNLGWIMYQL